ncbi:MAG TPA: hypothetical protein VNR17_10100 [Luteimicrobium sp.]|nr:hypothetical protein [Luteimicrobium sp.]
MNRYPSPEEETRDTLGRRIAELVATAGIGAIISVGLAGGSVWLLWSWVAWAATLVGAVFIALDERRLWRLGARAWETSQWELLRKREYRRREGIFLDYTLGPPELDHGDDDRPWQSVTIRLVQHGSGPLNEGSIREVEYYFGKKFEEGKTTRQNAVDGFCYKTELYGSALVLGRVIFKNWYERPLFVEQYISLPGLGPDVEHAQG